MIFLILHKKLGSLVLEVKDGDIVYRDGAFNQINQATNEVHILSEKSAMIHFLRPLMVYTTIDVHYQILRMTE